MLVQRGITQLLYRELNHNNRLSYVLVGMLAFAVAAIEFHELFELDVIYGGYHFVQQTIEPACAWDSLPYSRGGVNWYLICVSYMTFDNSRVIPFAICIGLVPTTFLAVRKYSNNLIGLLSALGLALNPVFLIFDSSSSYAQTWAIFFLGSLYLMKKFPIGSAVSFNLSLFSKAIPMAWGPFIIYGIFRARMKPSHKHMLYAGIGIPLVILWSLSLFDGGSMAYGYMKLKPISYDSFVEAVQWTWGAFRWNEEILLATPAVFGVYLWKRKAWGLPRLPFELLAVSMVSFFGIALFTVEGYFPYRIIPNLVMFLFAASTLLEKFVVIKLKL